MESKHPSTWRIAKLVELGEVNRGRSRHRPRYAAHLYGGPYPFIQTGDIRESQGRITQHSQTYSEAGLAQSRLWPAGTLCITIAANIAETGILTYPACFPDSVVGFLPDPVKCDARFIEYLFRVLRREIQLQASGSVQDNINLEVLGRLSFPLPPLDEQLRIVSVLGALDDKIELNRRMNQTLEATARGIFKDRFIGVVPLHWKTGPLLDEVDLNGGGTPKTSVPEFWGGPIPWFSVADAPAESDVFVVSTQKTITEAGLRGSAARLLPIGATIITARGTVGRVALVGASMAMNQSCYAFVSRTYGPFFTYFSVREMIATLKQRAHGSVFDTITRQTIEDVSVVLPPKEQADEFDRAVSAYLATILNNLHESRTIATLRDFLLPKLLSGEIRVRHAEKIAESAL